MSGRLSAAASGELFCSGGGFRENFKFHSAAKSVHHGFVGGLLEHTLSVTKLCDYYIHNYPMINADLLITAAIFHDIGKVYELSPFPENVRNSMFRFSGIFIVERIEIPLFYVLGCFVNVAGRCDF